MTDAPTPGTAPAPGDPPALRALLGGAIDYAGLFPPTALSMREAVEQFANYRGGEDRWALGRFVVPASRLAEMEEAIAANRALAGDSPWQLSATIGEDRRAEVGAVRGFNARHADAATDWFAAVDAIELRAGDEETIAELPLLVGTDLEMFVEIPIADDPRALVRAIHLVRARAKVRTGGVVAQAFPAPGELLRFIRACVEERVRFKATAGLHHPLRAEYRLTYEADSATGTMFGFLNVLLATALIRGGLTDDDALSALTERDPASIVISADRIRWRGVVLQPADLLAAREQAILGFGSCSFREPLDELTALGWR